MSEYRPLWEVGVWSRGGHKTDYSGMGSMDIGREDAVTGSPREDGLKPPGTWTD